MSNFVEVFEPVVDFSRFSPDVRDDGISGFMRLRNEAEFLALSIESWLPVLDELVIVYNNCQDNTGKIAQLYAKAYPDKIKVFHYVPIVYPQGSEQFHALPADSFHSLVNYYNFALSMTTKKWAIKIDGDLVIPPPTATHNKHADFRGYYKQMVEQYPDMILPMSGINIIDHQGELYVSNDRSKFCATTNDLCLFRVDLDSVFIKHGNTEWIDWQRGQMHNVFMYYHLKFMKSDYGIGNYELVANPNSAYAVKTEIFLLLLKLIPLEQVLEATDMPAVSLQDFGISRKRDYRVDATNYLRSQVREISTEQFIKEANLYLQINNLI